jgi:hypothetical protein
MASVTPLTPLSIGRRDRSRLPFLNERRRFLIVGAGDNDVRKPLRPNFNHLAARQFDLLQRPLHIGILLQRELHGLVKGHVSVERVRDPRDVAVRDEAAAGVRDGAAAGVRQEKQGGDPQRRANQGVISLWLAIAENLLVDLQPDLLLMCVQQRHDFQHI